MALDGTSLTVNGVAGAEFDVLLIRHSLEVTTWNERQAGDRVNLEVDQMARYAARLAGYAGEEAEEARCRRPALAERTAELRACQSAPGVV